MTISDQQIKKINKLILTGNRIHLGFLIEYGFFDWVDGIYELIKREKPMSFRFTYEDWYSKAFMLLENLHPTCLDEFILLYKNEKLQDSDPHEYAIFDFLVGNEIHRSYDYSLKVAAVKRNFESQLDLLNVIKKEMEAQLLQSNS